MICITSTYECLIRPLLYVHPVLHTALEFCPHGAGEVPSVTWLRLWGGALASDVSPYFHSRHFRRIGFFVLLLFCCFITENQFFSSVFEMGVLVCSHTGLAQSLPHLGTTTVIPYPARCFFPKYREDGGTEIHCCDRT